MSDEVPSPSSDSDIFLVGRDRRGFSPLIETFRVAAPPLIETFRFVVLLLSLIDDFSFGCGPVRSMMSMSEDNWCSLLSWSEEACVSLISFSELLSDIIDLVVVRLVCAG